MLTASRALFWAAIAITLFLTLRPVVMLVPGSDKTHHAIAFGVLMFLAAFAYPRIAPVRIAVTLSALGAAIELIQPFFGRSDDIRDWVADSVGIVVALLLVGLVRKLRLAGRNPAS